jgi:hypothetical protein
MAHIVEFSGNVELFGRVAFCLIANTMLTKSSYRLWRRQCSASALNGFQQCFARVEKRTNPKTT